MAENASTSESKKLNARLEEIERILRNQGYIQEREPDTQHANSVVEPLSSKQSNIEELDNESKSRNHQPLHTDNRKAKSPKNESTGDEIVSGKLQSNVDIVPKTNTNAPIHVKPTYDHRAQQQIQKTPVQPTTITSPTDTSINIVLDTSNPPEMSVNGNMYTHDEQPTSAHHYSILNLPVPQVVRELQLHHHDYAEIELPDGYFNYSSIINQMYASQIRMTSPSDHVDITGASSTLFAYGTEYVQLTLNPRYFDKYGLKTSRGIPMTEEIIKRMADKSILSENLSYITGIMLGLFIISQDNRLPRMSSTRIHYNGNQIGIDLHPSILKKLSEPVPPHPALSIVDHQCLWWRKAIKELLNDGTYHVGTYDEEENDVHAHHQLIIYAQNIDNFSAEVLNYNVMTFKESTHTYVDKLNELLAYSIGGTKITMTRDDNIAPDIAVDGDLELINFLIMSSKYPEFENVLLRTNQEYFEDSNFVSIMSDNRDMPTKLKTSVDAQSIRDFLTERGQAFSESEINRYFALEMTPMLNVKSMLEPSNTGELLEDLLLIFEYVVFSWIFPGLFDQIKGQVQNSLFQLISRCWPSEYSAFISLYGTLYTISPTGNFDYDSGNTPPWTQDLYLSQYHPSFWGFDYNRNHRTIPNITRIRKMFVNNNGSIVTDQRAVNAAFPRLGGSSHYIPFKPGPHATNDAFRLQACMLIEDLRSLLITRAQRLSRQTRTRSTLTDWLNHLVTQVGEVSYCYTNHLSLLYGAMANFRYNIYPNTTGNLSTYKPIHYYLVSANSTPRPTRRHLAGAFGSEYLLSTAIVWRLIFNCTYGLVDRTSSIITPPGHNTPLRFPDPVPPLTNDYNLSKFLTTATRMDAFLTTLLTYVETVAVYFYTRLDMPNDNQGLHLIPPHLYKSVFEPMVLLRNLEPPLEITVDTTIENVDEFILLNHKVVQVDNFAVITPELMVHLYNNFIIIVSPTYIQNDLPGIGPVAQRDDIRSAPYSWLSVDEDLDVASTLQQLLEPFETFTNTQFTSLHDALAHVTKLTLQNYGSQIIPDLGTIRSPIILKHLQILRQSRDNVSLLPYDPDIDPTAFAYITSTMDRHSRLRLSLGAKAMLTPRMRNFHTGVRVAYIAMNYSSPNYKPPVDGLRQYIYNPDDFGTARDGHTTVRVFSDPVTNIVYYNGSDMPKLHVIINKRIDIENLDYSIIEFAIMHRFWTVDIMDYNFTAEIVPSFDSTSLSTNPTYSEVLRSSPGSMSHLVFRDSVLAPEAARSTLPAESINSQWIFPLNPIDNAVIARAIVDDIGATPLGTRAPTADMFDTGGLEDFRPNYSDGSFKASGSEISMTNIMFYLHQNVRTNHPIKYTYVAPRMISTARL